MSYDHPQLELKTRKISITFLRTQNQKLSQWGTRSFVDWSAPKIIYFPDAIQFAFVRGTLSGLDDSRLSPRRNPLSKSSRSQRLLFVHRSVDHLSVYLSVCPYVFLFVCLSILSVYTSIFLDCLFALFWSVCLSVLPSISPSICLSVRNVCWEIG